MDNEIVRVYSGACKDIFTTNNGSSFCNQLYKTLKLPLHQYECGVGNVDFIPKVNNLFGRVSADNVITVKFANSDAKHIGIEEPTQSTLKNLVGFINKVLIEEGIRYEYFDHKVVVRNLKDTDVYISIGEGLNKVFQQKHFTIKAKAAINLSSIRHSVFQPRRIHILTDFTKNQFTAGRYLPIIKTLYSSTSAYYQETTSQITYVTVIKPEITTLKIKFVDDDFNDAVVPQSQSYVELIFRPKRL